MNTNNNIIRTLCILFLLCGYATLQAQTDPYYPDEPGPTGKPFDSYQFNERLDKVRGIFIQQDDRVGQARSYKKIDESLQGFLETEFMKKFKEFRLEVESLMSTFKAHQQSFKPAEVAKIRKAYAKFADKFNMNIMDIKRDFVDRKKLKFIQKYPTMYAASLELKLRDLADEYAQSLEKEVAELTGTDEYAAIPLLAILSVVQFGIDFSNYLARMRYDARKVKEEHLNQFFVEPFHLKRWEEIEMVGGDIYNQFQQQEGYTPPQEPNYPTIETDTTHHQMDIFEMEEPPLNGN